MIVVLQYVKFLKRRKGDININKSRLKKHQNKRKEDLVFPDVKQRRGSQETAQSRECWWEWGCLDSRWSLLDLCRLPAVNSHSPSLHPGDTDKDRGEGSKRLLLCWVGGDQGFSVLVGGGQREQLFVELKEQR